MDGSTKRCHIDSNLAIHKQTHTDADADTHTERHRHTQMK